ncbi:MAG: hypothetical protein PHD58_00115 [Anaerolineales bacterium]|nr:hypothetical protein [Anaerolineales bacterium]
MKTVRNLTQAYSQAPWRKQVQVIGLIMLCVLFAVLVASIYLNVSARAATYGREILMMQDQIREMQLVNADLHTRLGVLLSSAEMEKRALEMGFVPIEKGEAVYVMAAGYQPRRSVILAPPPKPVESVVVTLPPRFTQSLVDWLQERLMLTPVQAAEVSP